VQLIALLNDALATGWVCAMRHQRRYYTIRGGHERAAANASLRQAAVELEHADRIATRILELGGEPDLDPDRLSARAHALVLEHPYAGAPRDVDSAAANMAVESYRDLLAFVGDHDPRLAAARNFAADVDHARCIEALVRPGILSALTARAATEPGLRYMTVSRFQDRHSPAGTPPGWPRSRRSFHRRLDGWVYR
jgi:ferritin-like protein